MKYYSYREREGRKMKIKKKDESIGMCECVSCVVGLECGAESARSYGYVFSRTFIFIFD